MKSSLLQWLEDGRTAATAMVAVVMLSVWISMLGAGVSAALKEPAAAKVPDALQNSRIPPQAFTSAKDGKEAGEMLAALAQRTVGDTSNLLGWWPGKDASLVTASRYYFLWDTCAYIPSYTIAFLSIAAWGIACCRRRKLEASFLVKAAGFMPWAAAMTALGDLGENTVCLIMLSGHTTDGLVCIGHACTAAKKFGIDAGLLLLLGLGVARLRSSRSQKAPSG